MRVYPRHIWTFHQLVNLIDKASLLFLLHSSLQAFVHSFLFRNFRPCQHKTTTGIWKKKLLPFLQIKHGRSFSSNRFDTEIHRLWPLKTNPVCLHCSAHYLNNKSTGSATGDTHALCIQIPPEKVFGCLGKTVSWKNTFTGNLLVRCLGKVKHILPKWVIYHGRIPKNSPTKLNETNQPSLSLPPPTLHLRPSAVTDFVWGLNDLMVIYTQPRHSMYDIFSPTFGYFLWQM